MLVAHKIELRPTLKQKIYLKGTFSAKRFAYNKLVESYKNGLKFSKKEYQDIIKKLRETHEWIRDFSTRVVRNSVDDLRVAIDRAFSSENKKERAKRVAQMIKIE